MISDMQMQEICVPSVCVCVCVCVYERVCMCMYESVYVNLSTCR